MHRNVIILQKTVVDGTTNKPGIALKKRACVQA